MVVEILSAEECVSVRGFHLEHTLLDLQDRDIKGTASEIKYSDNLVTNQLNQMLSNQNKPKQRKLII